MYVKLDLEASLETLCYIIHKAARCKHATTAISNSKQQQQAATAGNHGCRQPGNNPAREVIVQKQQLDCMKWLHLSMHVV